MEVRRVAKQIVEEAVVPAASQPLAPPDIAKPTAAEQRSRTAYARRQARYEEAARLKTAGASLKRIAALIGAERKTVRRWLRAGEAPFWRKPRRLGGLAPYHDHLDRRWTEGCRNAAQLWRELVTLGFVGRPGTVWQWAGRRRKHEPKVASAAGINVVMGEPPSARQVARQLMTDDTLTPSEQNFVSRVLLQVPALAECVAAAKRLNAVLRRRSKEALDKVLDDAGNTALGSFVSSLRRDLSAVQAALDHQSR